MKTRIGVCVVVLLGTISHAYNLLDNSGFEGDVPTASWTFWGNAAVENWFRPPEGTDAAYLKGSWAGRGVDQGLYQVTSPGSVVPGMEYDVTGTFYKNDGWCALEQYMKIDFLDSCGQVIGSAVTNLACLPMDQWTTHSIHTVAPADSSFAKVTFAACGAGECGSLGADRFILQAIPEPATLTLIGLAAGAGMWGMRRRRQLAASR